MISIPTNPNGINTISAMDTCNKWFCVEERKWIWLWNLIDYDQHLPSFSCCCCCCCYFMLTSKTNNKYLWHLLILAANLIDKSQINWHQLQYWYVVNVCIHAHVELSKPEEKNDGQIWGHYVSKSGVATVKLFVCRLDGLFTLEDNFLKCLLIFRELNRF